MTKYKLPLKKDVPLFGWRVGDKITFETRTDLKSGDVALLDNGDYCRLTNDTPLPAEPLALVLEWERTLHRPSECHWHQTNTSMVINDRKK